MATKAELCDSLGLPRRCCNDEAEDTLAIASLVPKVVTEHGSFDQFHTSQPLFEFLKTADVVDIVASYHPCKFQKGGWKYCKRLLETVGVAGRSQASAKRAFEDKAVINTSILIATRLLFNVLVNGVERLASLATCTTSLQFRAALSGIHNWEQFHRCQGLVGGQVLGNSANDPMESRSECLQMVKLLCNMTLDIDIDVSLLEDQLIDWCPEPVEPTPLLAHVLAYNSITKSNSRQRFAQAARAHTRLRSVWACRGH